MFDSSLEDVGHVLALAALLASESAREVRLGSLSLSRNSLDVTRFVDVMARFFRGELPDAAPQGSSVPIGMFDGTPAVEDAGPMITGVLGRRGSGGRPLYPRGIDNLNQTADPVAVIRNALSAEQDGKTAVVLAGLPTNLLGLLALPEGPGLVGRKVRELVISEPGRSFPALDQLLAEWPSPVVRVGDDLDVYYPASAIEQDFAWTSNHPVVDAYRSAGTMPYDAPGSAAVAVLCSARPDVDYFRFVDRPSGGRTLSVGPGQEGRIVEAIRELISRPPPEPRRGRGG